MKKIISGNLVLAVLMLSACNNEVKEHVQLQSHSTFNGLEKAAWLIGQWQNNSNGGHGTETWEKENDSTYSATSYFVVDKDTVSSEKIKLVQSGKDVFYIPTVRDQNSEQPVKFKMTSNQNGLLVFENPNHDFPQKITYLRISEEVIKAEISGLVNGKQKAQQFPMTRVK